MVGLRVSQPSPCGDPAKADVPILRAHVGTLASTSACPARYQSSSALQHGTLAPWSGLHQEGVGVPSTTMLRMLITERTSLHLLLLFGYKLRDNRLVGALRVDDFSARDARVAVLKLAAAVDGELCAHTNPRSTHTESNDPLDT